MEFDENDRIKEYDYLSAAETLSASTSTTTSTSSSSTASSLGSGLSLGLGLGLNSHLNSHPSHPSQSLQVAESSQVAESLEWWGIRPDKNLSLEIDRSKQILLREKEQEAERLKLLAQLALVRKQEEQMGRVRACIEYLHMYGCTGCV